MKTFVIAEVAACHDLVWGKAIRLIHLAKDIGADACKFQFLSSAQRLADLRHAEVYKAAYRNLELPMGWLPALKQECDRVGVEFMCTVYLPEDIPLIAPLVQRFKVASFEAGDLEFVRAHAPYGKPVILSTGMMEHRPGHIHGDMEVYWLHCTSSYPAPRDEMNLRVLHSGLYDGLSDHSRNMLMGGLAVAAGAKIIEFHMRLNDTSPDNADYAVAFPPTWADTYVAHIRHAEVVMGDGIKRRQPSEAAMLPFRRTGE